MSKRTYLYSAVALIFFAVLIVTSPPYHDSAIVEVAIPEGISTSEVGKLLEKNNIIYSDLLFRTISFVTGGHKTLKAGTYIFDKPIGTWSVVKRISNGDFGLVQIRVRIVEGSTREQIAEIVSDQLVSFDREEFLKITEGKEGMLFPDTYFFFQDADANDVALQLETTFNERIDTLEDHINVSEHSFDEILIMASIIQREAHDPEDQKIISSVLWNRIDIGMALQADATLYYLLGKASSELTQDDLKIDSPYNTYQYSGLPPSPISNPGLSALEAAVLPTDSEYFYYLSDSEGVTHFAEDFETHKANKQIYLR